MYMSRARSLTLGHYLDLPPGTEVLEIATSGESAWVHTVRVRTRQQDGSEKDYFKKVKGTPSIQEVVLEVLQEPSRWCRSENDAWYFCVRKSILRVCTTEHP